MPAVAALQWACLRKEHPHRVLRPSASRCSSLGRKRRTLTLDYRHAARRNRPYPCAAALRANIWSTRLLNASTTGTNASLPLFSRAAAASASLSGPVECRCTGAAAAVAAALRHQMFQYGSCCSTLMTSLWIQSCLQRHIATTPELVLLLWHAVTVIPTHQGWQQLMPSRHVHISVSGLCLKSSVGQSAWASQHMQS